MFKSLKTVGLMTAAWLPAMSKKQAASDITNKQLASCLLLRLLLVLFVLGCDDILVVAWRGDLLMLADIVLLPAVWCALTTTSYCLLLPIRSDIDNVAVVAVAV